MESNCGVLFIDLAIERGISDEDKEIPRFAYIEYLSRIEAKENGYYKNGEVAESAEGGTLLRCYVGQPASWVRIPVSPNFKGFRAYRSKSFFHFYRCK